MHHERFDARNLAIHVEIIVAEYAVILGVKDVATLAQESAINDRVPHQAVVAQLVRHINRNRLRNVGQRVKRNVPTGRWQEVIGDH